jgi:hypothetical protein
VSAASGLPETRQKANELGGAHWNFSNLPYSSRFFDKKCGVPSEIDMATSTASNISLRTILLREIDCGERLKSYWSSMWRSALIAAGISR